MRDGRDESPIADEPLGRPFLASPIGPDLPATRDAPEIRPYLLTGGRTEVDNPTIAIETIVVAVRPRTDQYQPWRVRQRLAQPFEKAAIVALCERPLSVAEVAAHQRLPLGVARVLVADLVAEGELAASSTPSDELAKLTQDVAFVERLIAGVAAL